MGLFQIPKTKLKTRVTMMFAFQRVDILCLKLALKGNCEQEKM